MSFNSILDRLAGQPVIRRRKKRLRPARFVVEALELRLPLTVIVDTAITVAASQGQTTYGQAVTLTATVAPSPGGGTVSFLDNGALVGTGPVASGKATLSNLVLTTGSHHITASFSGFSTAFIDDLPSSTVPLITTVAGNGTRGFAGDYGTATSAKLFNPQGIAVDSAGNLFIADTVNSRIRKVDHATGVITTVAGNGAQGFAGDNGAATSAELNMPTGVAVDAAGNLFIADEGNDRIREVDHASGVITTVAGEGAAGFSGDNGPATSAELASPFEVAVDAAGDLFIADYRNNRIREVDHHTGVITTVAGDGTQGFAGDSGPATSAELYGPGATALDSAGDLFIVDFANNRIREVDHATGLITTVAGNGTAGFAGDNGAATSAELNFPDGVAVDSAGNLFIADCFNNRIREVDHDTGVITTVAGDGTQGFAGDSGAATSAELNTPARVAVDSAGNLFIADNSNNRIREVANGVEITVTPAPTSITIAASQSQLAYGKAVSLTATVTASPTPSEGTVSFMDNGAPLGSGPVTSGTATLSNLVLPAGRHQITAAFSDSLGNYAPTSTGFISTVAGDGAGNFAGDNSAASAAQLNNPEGIAVDAAGDLFIADSFNGRIREVNGATGVITTVAGDGGGPGFGGDNGPATAAFFADPQRIAVDSAGDLFIADTFADRIRAVDHATGVITTVVGGGTGGLGDNGPATAAQLNNPEGIAVDAAGDLFIADSGNNRIRKVDHATGVISTVAGDGTVGFAGDDGPATAAQFNQPVGIAVDLAGDLFIADSGNNRIREVDHSTGVITTVAGNGTGGFAGDNGPATAAELRIPAEITLDSAGDLFIADTLNDRIRELLHDTGVITTVAGNGTAGFAGDNGPANSADLNNPLAIALDAGGDLFIADSGNNRIREVADIGVTVTVTPASLTITADSKSKAYGAALPTFTASYSGFVNGDTVASLTTPPTLSTTATAGSHVSGNPYTITASGAVDPNYTITYLPGALTVNPAPLTITADNQSKVYGAALPPLTASYSGFVNGDSATSLATPPTLATTATASSHVSGSPYPITASGAVDADYAISYAPGSLTVSPATLTVAADNKTKALGDENPTLTYTITGFVNGDSASVVSGEASTGTTATAASDVGTYPIAVSPGTLNAADYTFALQNGTLTITVNSQGKFGLEEDIYVIGSGTVTVLTDNGVLSNDSAPSGLTVTSGTVTGAEGGTFVFNADGSFTYTPPANSPGFDDAKYTAQDASGDSGTATVNVLSQPGGVIWKFFEQVLHRDPAPTDLAFFIPLLAKYGSGVLSADFFESDELLNQVISGYYQQFLGRPPSDNDLTFWENIWHQTGGPEGIKAQFAQSPEFNALAGNQTGTNPTGWITALYERILNRSPQGNDLPFWQQQLASGVSENQVALDFFTSPEAYGNDVTGWFQEYLSRAPASTEQAGYISEMLAGATDRTIEQAITNLPEYANAPPASPAGTGVRLPNYLPAANTAKVQASLAATDAVFGQLT